MLFWVAIRFLVAIVLTYFARRALQPSNGMKASLARYVIVPNFLAFLLLLAVIATLKYMVTASNSQNYTWQTLWLLIFAQAIWTVMDALRHRTYSLQRSDSRSRSSSRSVPR